MPSASGLVTAIVDGHTLTSPTVYYSFDYLWTWGWKPFDFTESPKPLLTNQIIPMNTEDVSTVWQNPCDDYFYTYSMDWSNLNAPVPIQAYNQAYGCWDEPCSVVYGAYAPYLALPSQLLKLNPAWSTCTIATVGVFDPPHALQGTISAADPVDTFTTAKTPLPATTAAPAPGHTASSVVSATAVDPSPARTTDGSRPPSQPTHIGGDPGDNPHASSPGQPKPGNQNGQSLSRAPGKGSNPSNGGAADPDKGGNKGSPAGGSGSGSDPGAGSSSGNGGDGHAGSNGNGAAGTGNGGNSDPPSEASDAGHDVGPGDDANSQGGRMGQAIPSILRGGHQADPNVGTDPGGSPGRVVASMFGGLPNADGSPDQKEPSGQFDPESSNPDNNGKGPANGLSAIPNAAGTSDHAMPFAFVDKQPIYEDSSSPGAIIIGSLTLTAGDPAITVDGTRVSVASNGYVIVGTSSARIPIITSQADAQSKFAWPAERLAAFVGTDGVSITASEVAAGTFVADGQTLLIGGPAIQVDGDTVSAASNGLVVVNQGQTSTVPFSQTTAPLELGARITLADGSVVTAFEEQGKSGIVILNGHTLLPGDVLTIDGETIRDGSAGLVVLDGSRTLTVGGSAATIDGVTVGQANRGSAVATGAESSSTVMTAPGGFIMTSEATGAQTTSANAGERRWSLELWGLAVAFAIGLAAT
ncbi:MAG: hypothetical protein M1821_000456 [Bathelium mastoideum]|nr:MAG: hypothetical protein M1821_000456 [Bathelium mastoideum]